MAHHGGGKKKFKGNNNFHKNKNSGNMINHRQNSTYHNQSNNNHNNNNGAKNNSVHNSSDTFGARNNKAHELSSQRSNFVFKDLKCGVLFYNNLEEAVSDIVNIETKAGRVDKLNVVIKSAVEVAPSNSLCKVASIYTGDVWTAIHKRRLENGWYLEI